MARTASGTLDWQAVADRLGRAERLLTETIAPPPGEVARQLKARAAELSKPLADNAATSHLDLVFFRSGSARFAVATGDVAQAVRLASVTALPGLPPFYLGLVHQRGGLYPLLDIVPLFGLGPRESGAAAPGHALLVELNGKAAALAADDIEGIIAIDAGALSGPDEAGLRHPAIAGLTPDSAIVVDAHRLLDDARLTVNEQPVDHGHGQGDTT